MGKGNGEFAGSNCRWIWRAKGGSKKYLIKKKEYLLRVVFKEKDELIVVITAYLTSRIERYWKDKKDEN